ncbi:MAG: 5-bromo-4-chloroindolyl phosphate hydrolysis family protein [Beijerinckiaceae bacterium]|nr:5-bromo-4-chloroindolyl phosphate hydrolysis family protein [Beijerinckiaceae bacterium]
MFRGFSALALAAAMAPFFFFALITLWALGLTVVTFGPVIFAFIAWILLSRAARRQRAETKAEPVIEARILRETAPDYPAEAYSPPAHFDLLLGAKHDIGRVRGAAGAIPDSAIARQFRVLADVADTVHARLMAEPVKLGLARRYFASYLPRAADLAEGYHRLRKDQPGDESRRAKLLDVLYRLESAMKKEEAGLSAPEMSRIDADIRILSDDLKGYDPDFTRAPEPLLNRVDEIVRSARRKS